MLTGTLIIALVVAMGLYGHARWRWRETRGERDDCRQRLFNTNAKLSNYRRRLEDLEATTPHAWVAVSDVTQALALIGAKPASVYVSDATAVMDAVVTDAEDGEKSS